MPSPANKALTVLADAAWASTMAELLAERMTSPTGAVICLPTGATPLPVYDRLPTAIAALGRPVSSAIVILDEYLGLPHDHPARCDVVIQQRLLRHLDPAPACITFDVDGRDPDEGASLHAAAVAKAGGLDLVVLGLGQNGHVGMNEPGARPNDPTRVVELTPSSRQAAIAYGADPPPTHGVTVGMAEILAAREVWLLVTGEAKADVLAATLHGPVGAEVPASYLRTHPRLRIIADEGAASSLEPRGC